MRVETPLELSEKEEENEIAIGEPEFVGTIGTFPNFARTQGYFHNKLEVNVSDPGATRHPYSHSDGYIKLVADREQNAKGAKSEKRTYKFALKKLIEMFYGRECEAAARGKKPDGQFWRLQSLGGAGKKAGKIDDKTMKKLIAEFCNSNGTLAPPTDGKIGEGGGMDAALSPATELDDKVMSAKQTGIALRFFAVRVASFFYSRTRCKEQWDVDCRATEAQREAELEASLEQEEGDRVQDGVVEDEEKAVEARLAKMEESVSDQVQNDKASPSPLSLAEVPQFVRDAVNVIYPFRLDELELQLIGVEEIDVLFYHASQPLKTVVEGLVAIANARTDMLQASVFPGEYQNVTLASGKIVRTRKFTGEAPSAEVALRNIKDELRKRHAEKLRLSPAWCPPKFRSETEELDSVLEIHLSVLEFTRFHLEEEDGEDMDRNEDGTVINPHADLLEAVTKFEQWYRLNSLMSKAMTLQRDYIMFFQACMVTDKVSCLSQAPISSHLSLTQPPLMTFVSLIRVLPSSLLRSTFSRSSPPPLASSMGRQPTR